MSAAISTLVLGGSGYVAGELLRAAGGASGVSGRGGGFGRVERVARSPTASSIYAGLGSTGPGVRGRGRRRAARRWVGVARGLLGSAPRRSRGADRYAALARGGVGVHGTGGRSLGGLSASGSGGLFGALRDPHGAPARLGEFFCATARARRRRSRRGMSRIPAASPPPLRSRWCLSSPRGGSSRGRPSSPSPARPARAVRLHRRRTTRSAGAICSPTPRSPTATSPRCGSSSPPLATAAEGGAANGEPEISLRAPVRPVRARHPRHDHRAASPAPPPPTTCATVSPPSTARRQTLRPPSMEAFPVFRLKTDPVFPLFTCWTARRGCRAWSARTVATCRSRCAAETLVAFAVIDNLVKGAAGGGVQWMNRLFDLPESTGLELPGLGWL